MTMRKYKTVDGKTVIGYEVLLENDIEEMRKKISSFKKSKSMSEIGFFASVALYLILITVSIVLLVYAFMIM